MDMYRIVFSGKLLDGFQMPDVHKAAAMRFRLNDAQVVRLFSGERSVLKKAVSADSAQPYLAELARMGMHAELERIAPLDAAEAARVSFKVVFWGKSLPGYTRDQVMRAVPRRLRVNELQVARMFSGAKAVLKRGVSAETGARYVSELARIGMQVELEIETDSLPAASGLTSVAPGLISQIRNGEEDSYGNFLQTQIDLQQSGSPLETNIMGGFTQSPIEVPQAITPPMAPPRKVAQPHPSERLASAIEAAYVAELGHDEAAPELRCTQCGHRQKSGTHCNACGCLLPKRHKAIATAAPIEVGAKGGQQMGDVGTLMAELRRQSANHFEDAPRRNLRLPIIVGGAACVLAVGGWLFLH